MDSNGVMQRSIQAATSITASIAASVLSLVAAGCGVSDEPGIDDVAIYTPYGEVAIEAVSNAPFAVPAFSRPSFHRRQFNVADFGAVGDGTTKNTEAFARAVAAAKKARGGQI